MDPNNGSVYRLLLMKFLRRKRIGCGIGSGGGDGDSVPPGRTETILIMAEECSIDGGGGGEQGKLGTKL